MRSSIALFALALCLALSITNTSCIAMPVRAATTPETTSPVEAPAVQMPQAFRSVYWESSVEIRAFYSIAPTRAPKAPGAASWRKTKGEFVLEARGTGVIVITDGEKGESLTIVTAKHVVDGSVELELKIGRYSYRVKTAGTVTLYPTHDLAVIRFKASGSKGVAAPFADRLPDVGDVLFCVGNALGHGLIPTSGMMQRPEPVFLRDSEAPYWRGGYAALPGNSGGPVFYDGKLIGIVAAIMVYPGTKQLLPNMGLFVGIRDIRSAIASPITVPPVPVPELTEEENEEKKAPDPEEEPTSSSTVTVLPAANW